MIGRALGAVAGLLLLAEPGPPEAAAAFEEAHRRYLAGDFEEAAHRYQALVAAGHDGAALHYDLGNALFRAGRTGRAAASWERALRRDPGDAEARANLELVRRSFAARMPWARPEPLGERIAARVSDAEAAAAFEIPWLFFWAALGLRLRARGGRRAGLGLAAAAAFLLAAGGGLLVAGKARELRAPRAVVAGPGSSLHESPSPSVKPSLELPEGAPLRAVGVAGDGAWLRVRLPGGLEGYVQSDQVEVI